MSEIVTLDDVERLCWTLSGWQVEQRDVDRLLVSVQAYADAATGSSGAAAPLVVEGDGAQEATDGPVQPLTPPAGTPEPPEPSQKAQGAVQRIHLTGRLTLICPGVHDAPPCLREHVVPTGPDPEGTRRCRACGRVQDLAEFSRDSHGREGRRSTCRECNNLRKRDAKRAKRQAVLEAQS